MLAACWIRDEAGVIDGDVQSEVLSSSLAYLLVNPPPLIGFTERVVLPERHLLLATRPEAHARFGAIALHAHAMDASLLSHVKGPCDR